MQEFPYLFLIFSPLSQIYFLAQGGGIKVKYTNVYFDNRFLICCLVYYKVWRLFHQEILLLLQSGAPKCFRIGRIEWGNVGNGGSFHICMNLATKVILMYLHVVACFQTAGLAGACDRSSSHPAATTGSQT